MQLINDTDVSIIPLDGQTVAVLGYGNQGRAQALNLRDSGVNVIVGNRDDEYRQQAIDEGFAPVTILEAATAGDVLLVLTTDECMPEIWADHIAPGIQAGNTLWLGKRIQRRLRFNQAASTRKLDHDSPHHARECCADTL